MSDINSANQRRQMAEQQAAQAQKSLRQFTVGAPEEAIPQRTQTTHTSSFTTTADEMYAPSEAEVARKEVRQVRAEEVRISSPAKRRIEHLAGIGRLTRDVALGGTTFSLRTLKAKETREAALGTLKPDYTQLEAGYEARCQQLARSIYQIDGKDIEMVLGDNSIETIISSLEDLEDSLVTRLFDEFLSLKKEAAAKFGISTEAEAKEVAEDLKK